MAKIRQIPYGVSNFQQLRKENLYYSDKTEYLVRMENVGHFLFFTRPRRFGKSLFLSMMQCYYDINMGDRFDELFSGLYIHEHPTPERATFQVLFMDFSVIGGDSSIVQKNFELYGCDRLDDFAKRYEKYYYEGFAKEVAERPTFASKLNWIDMNAKNLGLKLYLIIDEYDNFTNNILNSEGEPNYHALTHSTGFYRDVFKLFKPTFNRILMMGVSPVTLDDLTSGYNIATSLPLRPEFNMMLGFSEVEVREMIRYFQSVGLLKADEDFLIKDMKPWYDNYCFSKDSFFRDPKMFNTDMVIGYLNYFVQVGHAPEDHLDRNAKMDYKKLKNLVYIDKSDSTRKSIIMNIIEQGYILGNIKESFPAERITEEGNFISLLFYYGMLTILGTRGARLKLGIPNNNVRQQYYGFLRDEYSKKQPIDISSLQNDFDSAAFDGDWRPMIETITDAYCDNSTVRSMIEGERNIQGFMSAFFSLNPYYLIAPEVELNHGYCDFFFLPDHTRYPDVAHSYIIELKYLKSGSPDQEAVEQWDNAVAQIHQYAEGKVVQRLLDGTRLHLLVVQIKGYKRFRAEEV